MGWAFLNHTVFSIIGPPCEIRGKGLIILCIYTFEGKQNHIKQLYLGIYQQTIGVNCL